MTINLSTANVDVYKLFYNAIDSFKPSGSFILNSFPLEKNFSKFPLYVLPKQRLFFGSPVSVGRGSSAKREFPLFVSVQMFCLQSQRQEKISVLEDSLNTMLLSYDWESVGLEFIGSTPVMEVQKVEVNNSPLYLYEVEFEFKLVV